MTTVTFTDVKVLEAKNAVWSRECNAHFVAADGIKISFSSMGSDNKPAKKCLDFSDEL